VLRFLVHGVVQGVGFRWFVAGHARRLGLGGWVRNRDDGSVEVVVAGDPARVTELEELLGRGPVGARVTRVDRGEVLRELELPKTFDIK
jgi:acylphosphatase